MLESQFVRDTCLSYTEGHRRKTIKGLASELTVSRPTLHRCELEQYQPGKGYSLKPSWNRKIANADFKTVSRAMARIRDERSIKNGNYSNL